MFGFFRKYPGDYNYHYECKEVVALAIFGAITEAQAEFRLQAIENKAYELDPDAEPDGDITYCVANALHEIRDLK